MERADGAADEGGGGRRKRRRRRRRGGGSEGAEAAPVAPPTPVTHDEDGGRPRRGRRLVREDGEGPGVVMPPTGKVVSRPKVHRKKGKPVSGVARRRRLSRTELDDLVGYFTRMPEPLLSALYRALGGQPSRVPDVDRMTQLTVRAIAQGSRLGVLLHQMHQRDRQALAALVQCGGLAHADEFHRELSLMLGGREGDWARTMQMLSDRGVVFASEQVEEGFYYLVPEPLLDHLLEHLEGELALPTFQHEEIRVVDQRPFCPALDFSLATLATWMDQHPPKLTQRRQLLSRLTPPVRRSTWASPGAAARRGFSR